MITGKLASNGNGFDADIHAMTFDLKGLRILPNDFRSRDNHPDYHIEATTPRGRALRIGSMWAARSERSGQDYFSISLTDRMGRDWRMNAVRNEDMDPGDWQIVPLAGGRTDPVMLNGRIETTDDGALVGSIGSYDFDIDFVGMPNAFRTSDDHPDFHIEVKSPAGVVIRMGSIWKATSGRTGASYLSLAFHSPWGGQLRANGLRREGDAEGVYEIVPLTGPKTVASAA